MNTNNDNPLLFASENTIFRIVSIARVVSWVILAIYLISFGNEISSMIQGQMSWPTQTSQWLMLIANLLFAPAIGLFYFLVLQGVAQGLNLALDIYYQSQPDGEELPSASSTEAAALD